MLYRIDAEKGEGKEIAKEYGVRAYPTFILANSEGKQIDIWLGYSKSQFINTISQATKDLSTIDEKQARFEIKPDLTSALTLARFHSAKEDYKEAVAYYMHAQTFAKEPSADFTYDIFDNAYDGMFKELFTYDEASRAADAALVSKANDPELKIWIARRMATSASDRGHADDVARYLQSGLDLTSSSDGPDMKRTRAQLMVDFSLLVKHDTATAVEYKKTAMPESWTEDPNQLNEFAWWCFEHKVNLPEAERLSRKSIELAKPGREKANNIDTLAEILNARGKTQEALEFSKKAATEDPSNKYFQEQVARFEKELSSNQ